MTDLDVGEFLDVQETRAAAPRGTARRVTPCGGAGGAGASTTLERLWEGYLAELADGRRIVETKAQHDLRVTVAIARVYDYDPPSFSYFLSTKKIGTGRPATSDFHPMVVHWLRSTGDRTGVRKLLCRRSFKSGSVGKRFVPSLRGKPPRNVRIWNSCRVPRVRRTFYKMSARMLAVPNPLAPMPRRDRISSSAAMRLRSQP
jgi:hypothetical protein